jgi:hypothetical protein
MFAKRFPQEHKALQNAKYDGTIMSIITSSCGGVAIVKFDDYKIAFMFPGDYPSSKMAGYFVNEVPNYPFYAKCSVNTIVANIFKCPNDIMSYIHAVKQSLDEVNFITNKVHKMSL